MIPICQARAKASDGTYTWIFFCGSKRERIKKRESEQGLSRRKVSVIILTILCTVFSCNGANLITGCAQTLTQHQTLLNNFTSQLQHSQSKTFSPRDAVFSFMSPFHLLFLLSLRKSSSDPWRDQNSKHCLLEAVFPCCSTLRA